MKSILKRTALCLTAVMAFGSMAVHAAALPFTDVPADAYYYDSVQWAVEHEVTKGTSDTAFSPDKGCTRAEVVTFLYRAFGEPETSATADGMTDVPSGAYFAKPVAWAVEKGITNGTSNTTFSPDNECSRAEIVTFLWRSCGSPEAGRSMHSDVPADRYYTQPVGWAVANGITKGTSPDKFSPYDPCTRSQIVTFLYRAKDLIQKPAPEETPTEPTNPDATTPEATEDNSYEQFIDPRIKLDTDIYSGARDYEYKDSWMSVVDERTWGEPPRLEITENDSIKVTYKDKQGKKHIEYVESHEDINAGTCGWIQEDGTFRLELVFGVQ